jgi:hypothetical protein
MSQIPAGCREVIRSAVECALTLNQTVRDPVTGETYTGWWGLAPAWLGGVLSTDGRRYVTACMVQRLNFSGTRVPILLEGDHPAIAHNPIYCPQYPLMESTVFGDLFSSTTPLGGQQPAFDAYVCWENMLPQECGSASLPSFFATRICHGLPQCGLTVLGPCNLSCMQHGPYWRCKPSLFSPWWAQTVRVKLERATCR